MNKANSGGIANRRPFQQQQPTNPRPMPSAWQPKVVAETESRPPVAKTPGGLPTKVPCLYRDDY